MSLERRKVLDMVAQGTLTAEDAERLLDKLSDREKNDEATGARPSASDSAKGSPRYLRIQVDGDDDKQVNIRVPLGLVRAGMKLGAIVPERVRERLERKGIDIENLGGFSDDVLDALGESGIDVTTDDGHVVRIFRD